MKKSRPVQIIFDNRISPEEKLNALLNGLSELTCKQILPFSAYKMKPKEQKPEEK